MGGRSGLRGRGGFVREWKRAGFRLKPHDLRHGVAMEVYGEHHDLEQVRALLGHQRIETTQVYTQIQPAQLKESVRFYEARAREALTT